MNRHTMNTQHNDAIAYANTIKAMLEKVRKVYPLEEQSLTFWMMFVRLVEREVDGINEELMEVLIPKETYDDNNLESYDHINPPY